MPWSPYAESGVFGKAKIQAAGLTAEETSVIRKLVTEHGGVFFDEGGRAPHFINYVVAGHGKKPKAYNEAQTPIVSKVTSFHYNAYYERNGYIDVLKKTRY